MAPMGACVLPSLHVHSSSTHRALTPPRALPGLLDDFAEAQSTEQGLAVPKSSAVRLSLPSRVTLVTLLGISSLLLLFWPRVWRTSLGLYHAYEAAALSRPLLTKSATSGVAYLVGDALAQVRLAPPPPRPCDIPCRRQCCRSVVRSQSTARPSTVAAWRARRLPGSFRTDRR